MTTIQGERTHAQSDTAESREPGLRSRRSPDWPAFCGIAFAPLFIAAVGTSAWQVPETDAPITEWVDWATDDANGTAALLSAYVTCLAALAFFVFAVGLGRRIRAAQGDGGLAASSVYGLGLLCAGFLAAAGVAWNNGPVPYLFDEALPDPTDVHVFVQLQSVGYGLAFVCMAVAAAALIAITSASLRHQMPGWFSVFGYVAAVALLGSVAFVPLFALPIWTLIAGVLFVRRPIAA